MSRAVTTRRRAAPERALHQAIAKLLAYAAPRHVIWWHTPNGEKRDKATAGILKSMGVLAGVPDFLLYDTRTGYLHCIEAKTDRGDLSDAQRGWKARFDQSPTGRYAVARSVEDAHDALHDWWPRLVPSVILPVKPSVLPQRKPVAGKSMGGR